MNENGAGASRIPLGRWDWTVLLIVALLWLIAAPLAFITLYSALELQSSAKNTPEIDAKLATLETVSLADKLRAAEREKRRYSDLATLREQQLNLLFNTRNELRARAIAILSETAPSGADDVNPVDQCTAPKEVLDRCQLSRDMRSCTDDWILVRRCSEQAVRQLRASDAERSAEVAEMDRLLDQSTERAISYNETAARLQSQEDVEDHALRPVADAYLRIRLPLFRSIFVLPDGVLVVCFTMLVGCIAAAVSSLVSIVRDTGPARLHAEQTAKAFIASPLIGGLAGFMVYFVVVAGTTFVTQDHSGEAAPVNNLSVPALASLGVFAGLAAETAIAWLQDKAGSFFGK